MVAQGLLPYLELLTTALVSPAWLPRKRGASYLLSCVADAPPAEVGSGLGSTLTIT